MPVMYNTGDWFSLRPGSTFRKIELYNLDWKLDIDIENVKVFGSPFGGPIAIINDPNQIIRVKGTTKPTIRILKSSGEIISVIYWKHGNLVTLGWSDSEELICVQDDGQIIIYDMYGEEKHSFNMGQEANYTKIIDARIFPSAGGTGIAVMTTNFRIFLVHNIKEPKNRQLPEMPKSISNPTCWDVITEDRNSYCLVGRDREIIKLIQGQSIGSVYTNLIDKPFKTILKMSLSYNHIYLAICTNNGVIWLGTTDMKTKFCEFDTCLLEIPHQIEWILDAENCRQSDAIIVTYRSLLVVVNTNGDQNTFTYDPAIFLIPEMDGVRIITNSLHEIIQKVPNSVRNIFAINSQEPSSYLFDAHKKFQEKSHQSDEYLELFRNSMEVAVNECIDAAGYEFDSTTQKSLIKAAYFGKGFLHSHNPEKYINMCRILRVLNALRSPSIAIPLTFKQFCHIQPNVIIDRLVFRKHYAVAIQIAKHLNLPEYRILEHWAYHKVIYDKDDTEVIRKITEKFKNPTVRGVSFCNIAEKAHSVGRDELAIKLLDLEESNSMQVPLLLKLGENEKALSSASKSGNTDLVCQVLLQLKESTPLDEFQMIIRQFPLAHDLYKKYCQKYSIAALQELFKSVDDYQSQAEHNLRDSIENHSVEHNLFQISMTYNKAFKSAESDLCADTRKLYKVQSSIADKSQHDINFYELSLNDTVFGLLQCGEVKQAEKIKNEFKMSDKRFWWLRVRVHSDQQKWDELDKFSKTKKSPIGYEPFVEVCLNKGNIEEGRKYILKCRDDSKVKWYLRAGLLDEAASHAFEKKDVNCLKLVRSAATRNGNGIVIEKVDSFLRELSLRN